MNPNTIRPRLIVTVDTEEDGAWSGAFRATGNTTRNLRSLPAFQDLCDEFGVRPTYLIDAPVVEDPWAVELLRGWQEGSRCEVGAHCHPWCNPPVDEEAHPHRSFLCALSESSQRRKVRWLTEAITDRVGRRPTSFRAGRYGLDDAGARILVEHGYTVDSSVLPLTDYSRQGGPDFTAAPLRPYRVSENLLSADPNGHLLEVPVTVGFTRAGFASQTRWRSRLALPHLQRLRLVGLCHRLGVIRRVKLSPEQTGARDMRRLIDAAAREGLPSLVLMLHSSSLMPGASPYILDSKDLRELFARLRSVFDDVVRIRRWPVRTLTEFKADFVDDVGPLSSNDASGNRFDRVPEAVAYAAQVPALSQP